MSNEEVAHDHSPFLKVYKDGRVERFIGTAFVPPSLYSQTGVNSKDVVISPETGLSARLYVPQNPTGDVAADPIQKLPLLVYFHGGGFCIESAFSPAYNNYVNLLASKANAVVVSVNYRLAPEYHLPIAYDDSWEALKWVAAHFDGDGSDEWLNSRADFNRLFFAGDSAGGNIAHRMAIRIAVEKLPNEVKLRGLVLVHPFFWGEKPIGAEANDDKDPDLGKLGCEKVVVFVAEKDVLKERGWWYGELLRKSGWVGVVEVVETKGEDHCFHLTNHACDNALDMLNKISAFISQ
ncbi:hypothetical protein UlMin_043402 [Ulmus minor]